MNPHCEIGIVTGSLSRIPCIDVAKNSKEFTSGTSQSSLKLWWDKSVIRTRDAASVPAVWSRF